jgi:hypothetical protein
MANLPKFTDADFTKAVDFDMKRVFDMPSIEQMIFFYVNFDKCRKQIIRYEDKRAGTGSLKRHPKESKKEALDLL